MTKAHLLDKPRIGYVIALLAALIPAYGSFRERMGSMQAESNAQARENATLNQRIAALESRCRRD